MSLDFNEVIKQQLGAMLTMGMVVVGASLLAAYLENQPEDAVEVELIPPEDVPKYQFNLDRAKIIKAQKRHETE